METFAIKNHNVPAGAPTLEAPIVDKAPPAPIEKPIVEKQPIVKEVVKIKTEPAAPIEKKYWDDEYKAHFGDEDVETVKGYKTKVSEYEPKLSEYEKRLKEYEDNKVEFANDNIKRLNDLAKAGKEITPKTVAFLNRDFSKVEEPMEMLKEAMKEANPKWTDKEIAFELKTKYRLDQFQGIEDEELTDEQRELKEVMEGRIKRDALEEAEKLTAKQKEFQFVKEPTPEEVAAVQKQQKEADEEWEKVVEKISKDNTKIKAEFKDVQPIEVFGEKVKLSPFEYEPTKEEKERADSFFHNSQNFWNSFAEKDGTFSDKSREKIYQAMAFVASGENYIAKLAESKFLEAVEYLTKNDKKINFEARNTQNSQGTGKKLKLVQK